MYYLIRLRRKKIVPVVMQCLALLHHSLMVWTCWLAVVCLLGGCMFSLCLYELSLGAPASYRSPNTCMLG